MIKRTLFFAALLALTSATLTAQNDCLAKYDRDGIYLRYEFWRGNTYVKNGTSRPVGFAYNKLAKEFEQSPAGLPLFKKSQRNFKIAAAVSIASTLLTVGGALLAVRQIDRGYTVNERRYQEGLSLMINSVVLGATVSLVLNYKSRRQLDDALWLRNRELFQQ